MNTTLSRLAYDFSWIHLGIGIFGHSCFFVGSVLFLYSEPIKRIGVWLFIVGAFGMLIGKTGNAFLSIEQRRRTEGVERRTPRRADAEGRSGIPSPGA